MLTDTDLQKLHRDKEYIRSNNVWRNYRYVKKALRDVGSEVSLEIGHDGVRVGFNILRILWGLLRFYVITREIVDFRRRLIESVLCKGSERNAVRHSIPADSIWLDYSMGKLKLLRTICIDYLMKAENRIVFNRYAQLSPEECQRLIIENKVTQVDDLFDQSLQELAEEMFIYTHYLVALRNMEIQKRLCDIFMSGGSDLISGRRE